MGNSPTYCVLHPKTARQHVRKLLCGRFSITVRPSQVLVDGCDVKEMDLQCLRSMVGLVSQEPVLFSCSVRDNICYGNPEANQQQVEDAARAANAHSFIQKLPEGYSTQVHLLHLMPHSMVDAQLCHLLHADSTC